MSDQIFKNNRDKNDFLIALGVIGFFLWLFLFSGLLGKKAKLNHFIPTQQEARIVDSDEDGLIDSVDACPDIYARTISGCPNDEVTENIKVEKKSIKNYDKTAEVAGLGTVAVAGKCLTKDGKCIGACKEKEANCPNKGTKDCCCKNGKTVDCPNKDKKNADCHDKDKKLGAGVAALPNKDANADKDGDGVIDSEDQCPEVAGDKENDGCPKLILEKVEEDVISEAIRDVRFDRGKATLTATSLPILDKVVALMKKYPNSRLFIEGHTDNDSSSDFNLQLSKDRANTCKAYIEGKGIATKRISAKGFGESKPIARNETEAGRKKNRRVEFSLR